MIAHSGIAAQHRDAPSPGIAKEAGLEHEDDVYHVVVEYLSERLGLIDINGMDHAYLTEDGMRHVERLRAMRER